MSSVLTLAEPTVAAPLQGCRVLVADDDSVCLELAAAALEDAGASVDRAVDGRAAVLSAVAQVPHLLVTDVDMPELDGLSAAGILRWDFGLVELPIIALSSASTPPSDLLVSGITAFLPKPVCASLLVGAAATCLHRTADTVSPGPGLPETQPDDFDHRGAMARMGGRRELLERMVNMFLENHAAKAHGIAEALSDGDGEAAHRLAHALCGTAASVGAERVHRAARALTVPLAKGRMPEPAALAALADSLADAAEAICGWLAKPVG